MRGIKTEKLKAFLKRKDIVISGRRYGIDAPGAILPGVGLPALIAPAIAPRAFQWTGLVLISFVLPAVLTLLIGIPCRKLGWIREGDLTLK